MVFNTSSGNSIIASGSFERSLPSPSAFPFDRNSQGRVLGQAFGREGGQHYFEISDSFESESGASYSSTPEPSFYCWGLFRSLQVVDLDRIRSKYDFSYGFSLAVPTGDAHIHQPEFVTLYDDTLTKGLHLPLHPLTRDLLIFLGIAPRQLAPNGWRFLIGAIHLWP